MPAPPLRDVVADDPALVLIGINPGLRSGDVGHHFAGNGNPFWRLLFDAKLIPEPLTHDQDQRLAAFGIGLTNLCPRVTRAAAELSPAELAAGRRVLLRKIRAWRPPVVAFVGLTVYQVVLALPKSGGPGEKTRTLGSSALFVVPNPSGLNASFPGYRDKLVWFQALQRFVARHRPADRATARRPESPR